MTREGDSTANTAKQATDAERERERERVRLALLESYTWRMWQRHYDEIAPLFEEAYATVRREGACR